MEKQLDIMNISLDDNMLPARLLEEALEYRMHEANEVTNRLYDKIIKQNPEADIISSIKEKKTKLVVDIDDDFMEKYLDGSIKLVKEKGKLRAQIRNKGQYGEKLSIKEESVDESNCFNISVALQLKAIEKSLSIINQQVKVIDKSVKSVLEGQQNDRLALYYSGVVLYIEAANIENEELKKQLIAQSLKTFSDAIFQLTFSIKSDIDYLERKEYVEEKKNQYTLLKSKIENINKSFMAIHQSSIMKAGIYCQQGEFKAMASVLQEYSRFIEGTVANNARMLSLCDPTDSGREDGMWIGRGQLHLDVSNIVKMLSDKDMIVYLEKKEDENDESL